MPNKRPSSPPARLCDIPGCTSDARYPGRKCEKHQKAVQHRRVPGVHSHPVGRPQKYRADLQPRSCKIRVARVNAALSEFIMDQTNDNNTLEEVLQDVKATRVISALTDHPSIDSQVGHNLEKIVHDMVRSHLTAPIINLVSDGLTTHELHSAFPMFSTRSIQRARQFQQSCNELLAEKYANNVEHHRVSEEEVVWIEQYFRDMCVPLLQIKMVQLCSCSAGTNCHVCQSCFRTKLTLVSTSFMLSSGKGITLPLRAARHF